MAGNERIAVIGAGFIGRAWAVVFARAGFEVTITDIDATNLAAARRRIETTLTDLEQAGLIEDPQRALDRIAGEADLAKAVAGAGYVQECGPENVEIKSRLFAELEELTGADTILASSTSGITASTFNRLMRDPSRALVAHPVNPPSVIPLVEVAPSPETTETVIARTMAAVLEMLALPVMGEVLEPVEHGVEAEIHRAHVQRGQLRLEGQRRLHALLDRHVRAAAGGDIDHRAGGLLDPRQERLEGTRILGRASRFGIAGMQVQDRCPGLRRSYRGFDDLLCRDRQVFRHRRGVDRAGDGAGDDDLLLGHVVLP